MFLEKFKHHNIKHPWCVWVGVECQVYHHRNYKTEHGCRRCDQGSHFISNINDWKDCMEICQTETGCFWWTWKKEENRCHLHQDKGKCYEGHEDRRVSGPPFCPGKSVTNISFLKG